MLAFHFIEDKRCSCALVRIKIKLARVNPSQFLARLLYPFLMLLRLNYLKNCPYIKPIRFRLSGSSVSKFVPNLIFIIHLIFTIDVTDSRKVVGSGLGPWGPYRDVFKTYLSIRRSSVEICLPLHF